MFFRQKEKNFRWKFRTVSRKAEPHKVTVCTDVHVTLGNPTPCSQLGSSLHGILQARILKWLAMPFPRGSSQLRDRIYVSYAFPVLAGRFFFFFLPLGPLGIPHIHWEVNPNEHWWDKTLKCSHKALLLLSLKQMTKLAQKLWDYKEFKCSKIILLCKNTNIRL